MALAQYVRTTVNEIVEKADLPGSIPFDTQARNYSSAQTSAVRRQGDRRTDVITLHRLMTEMAASPGVLTRDRYVARFAWGMQNIGDREFEVPPKNSTKRDLSLLLAATACQPNSW